MPRGLFVIRTINNILLAAVLSVASYIIITPYSPAIVSSVAQSTATEYDRYVYESTVTHSLGLDTAKLKKIPTENRIIIPKIQLDAPILEGDTKEVLDSGIWRRPQTSSPDQGSNTVIVAHRFLYTQNNSQDTFYFLDKLTTGDTITIFWNQKEYSYTVSKIRTVEPTEIAVEDATDSPTLTLYTCTPVWSAQYRLVVTALPYASP
jgi:sortase A